MKRAASLLLAVAVLAAVPTGAVGQPPEGASGPAPTPGGSGTGEAFSLTPYDPTTYTSLYEDPDGPITGSTYIFNPTANQLPRMTYDFAHMREQGINTVGFYNLVHMTDPEREALFDALEANEQKAVVRIEWYDGATFDFDHQDPTHADAASVLAHYNTDDPEHGYTALLDYLVENDRLEDVAYFAVNMPVDDGSVANHFVTPEHPDGRGNPAWAASQAPYAQYLLTGLREITGPEAEFYLSVFYGWDVSYPTPSYADIPDPADGYFFNNYSYPISAPPDETVTPEVRLNAPRLQHAMDVLMSQYPTQPVVVEYGLHTVEFSGGVVPNQTAGLMESIAAKTLALKETTAFYQEGSSAGRPFNVRGTLYFAQNLYKEEGNPPAVMDWTLDYPGDVAQAETEASRRAGGATVVDARGASGGAAVALGHRGASVEIYDLAVASTVTLRYRADRPVDVELAVNGAAPVPLRLPAAARWREHVVNLELPLQGALRVTAAAARGTLLLDTVTTGLAYEAENATSRGGARTTDDGVLLTRPASRVAVGPVHGGSRVTVRYAARTASSLLLSIDGTSTTLDVPALADGQTSADVAVDLTVPSGATLTLEGRRGAAPVLVDAVRVDGQYEAEFTGGLYNGARGTVDPTASAGSAATSFDIVGSSVVFTQVRAGGELTFRYAATQDARMTILGLGAPVPLALPSTGGDFTEVSLAVSVPERATVIVQRNADDAATGLTIDWLRVG